MAGEYIPVWGKAPIQSFYHHPLRLRIKVYQNISAKNYIYICDAIIIYQIMKIKCNNLFNFVFYMKTTSSFNKVSPPMHFVYPFHLWFRIYTMPRCFQDTHA